MFVVWLVTGILASLGVHDAVLLWDWFGQNWLITLALLLFLA